LNIITDLEALISHRKCGRSEFARP